MHQKFDVYRANNIPNSHLALLLFISAKELGFHFFSQRPIPLCAHF